MPYATNPIDGLRIYFEDRGGFGPPVVLYTGFLDPLQVAQAWGITGALQDEFRLIFADHRGHGKSDKPHEPEEYRLPTRVADHIAVLDEVGVDRAHVIGVSWGARLGFAIGERATDRVRSLVLCGNQPYEWDLSTPVAKAFSPALTAPSTSRIDRARRFSSCFSAIRSGPLPGAGSSTSLAGRVGFSTSYAASPVWR